LALLSFTLSPSILAGGNSSTGTITINGPAGTNGAVVSLSNSAPGVANVPSSVTIAAGQTSGSFTVTTDVVTTQTVATIGATFNSKTNPATLTVNPASLLSVTLSPNQVAGGNSSMGTVTLTGPTPKGGLVVKLSSSTTKATLPASVKIAAGLTSATFTVKTAVVTSDTTATIQATLAGSAPQSATLGINLPSLMSVSLTPSAVVGLTSSVGTVTLNGEAPSGGIVVSLSSNANAAIAPATVRVPAGQKHATFAVKTVSVAAQTVATITGSFGGITESATLTVNPPVVKLITLSPATVVGGGASTGRVTIGTPAPAGGITITLMSGNVAASVPATVSIPGGKISAVFSITTTAVTEKTTAKISGSLGGVTASAELTINK
jgi:hypothetical protein